MAVPAVYPTVPIEYVAGPMGVPAPAGQKVERKLVPLPDTFCWPTTAPADQPVGPSTFPYPATVADLPRPSYGTVRVCCPVVPVVALILISSKAPPPLLAEIKMRVGSSLRSSLLASSTTMAAGPSKK